MPRHYLCLIFCLFKNTACILFMLIALQLFDSPDSFMRVDTGQYSDACTYVYVINCCCCCWRVHESRLVHIDRFQRSIFIFVWILIFTCGCCDWLVCWYTFRFASLYYCVFFKWNSTQEAWRHRSIAASVASKFETAATTTAAASAAVPAAAQLQTGCADWSQQPQTRTRR